MGLATQFEELYTHLRIVTQDFHRALLHLRLCPCRRLAFLLCQVLVGSNLVVLDDFLGDPLHDRVRLLRADDANVQQQGYQDNQKSTSEHDFHLSHVVDGIRSEPLRHTDIANNWPREIGLSSY